MPQVSLLRRPNRLQYLFTQHFRFNTFSCFLLVGGASFVVDLTVYLILLNWAQWDAMIARGAAFTVGLSLTWLGHRKFTFRHRKQRRTQEQILWVILIAGIAAIANLIGFQIARDWLLTVTPLAAFFTLTQSVTAEVLSLSFGVLIGLVVNWLGSNYLTFKAQPQ
ncbi:GtrA family protein [uncultured Shewanella sp.]|uniref:GtrA family protein n=1 Tax=uncultured Shewanella sp. TaxID=173975 RepID=UPI0026292C13|nr:GtrA family protein [uncultured Shewanella sp.]